MRIVEKIGILLIENIIVFCSKASALNNAFFVCLKSPNEFFFAPDLCVSKNTL